MKTFIITLLSSPLSTKLSKECIEQAKTVGIETTIWPAVNGLDFGKQKMQEYQIKPFMLSNMNLPGIVGCFLSHFELWLKCIELNEPIIILEHDGYFLRSLPDDINDKYTDILQLDPYIPTSPTYDIDVSSTIDSLIEYTDPPASGIDATGEFVIGAYGYCIKPNAAKSLVNFALTVGSLPADVHIGRNLVDIKCTTASIIRLHPYYDTKTIHTDSSTANLGKFLSKE